MTTPTWAARYAASLMNTFGPPQLTLVRGEGASVWDSEGNRYLDLLGGIAVNALGHGHPALVEAVTRQLSTLGHISNFFTSPAQVELAEFLVRELGHESHVFFTNSGTEANEAAFKATRKTGRTHLVAAEGGFHGRTMGALALTSKEAYRTPFEPLPGEVTFVPYGDVAALAAAVSDRTAAVVLEPVQGEAGCVIPPTDYLVAAREVTTQAGALLWLDEIQTGAGRTGTWFAHRNPELVSAPVMPDLVTVAKGLAGGFPIGACLAVGAAADLLEPGNHGTTFGGNPPACAAALAVQRVIADEALMQRASSIGAGFKAALGGDERVREIRYAGALVGLDLTEPFATQVRDAALAHGFIVNACAPDRIRLAPPLILSDDDVQSFGTSWPTILDVAYEQGATA